MRSYGFTLACAAAAMGMVSSAFAAFTPINKPYYSNEDSAQQIIQHLYGGTFVPVASDNLSFTNGTITATRIPDSGLFNSPSLVSTNDGPVNGTDQVWQGNFLSASVVAMFSTYQQEFGYYDGATGGTYHKLFGVTTSPVPLLGAQSLVAPQAASLQSLVTTQVSAVHNTVTSSNNQPVVNQQTSSGRMSGTLRSVFSPWTGQTQSTTSQNPPSTGNGDSGNNGNSAGNSTNSGDTSTGGSDNGGSDKGSDNGTGSSGDTTSGPQDTTALQYNVFGTADLTGLGGQFLRWARGGQGRVFSSQNSDNSDGLDHMVTWQIDGLNDGVLTWLVMSEDQYTTEFPGDFDYNDLVVKIIAAPPVEVPEPGSAAVLTAALLGGLLAPRRRH